MHKITLKHTLYVQTPTYIHPPTFPHKHLHTQTHIHVCIPTHTHQPIHTPTHTHPHSPTHIHPHTSHLDSHTPAHTRTTIADELYAEFPERVTQLTDIHKHAIRSLRKIKYFVARRKFKGYTSTNYVIHASYVHCIYIT